MNDGYVYFVGPEADDTPIKIGWTASIDPSRRIATLQTACWLPLKCYGLLPGSQSVESGYHRELASWRVSGEWFDRTAALLLLAQEAEWREADEEWKRIVAEANAETASERVE